MTTSKQYYLEASRGIASIIVVAHHFTLAFLPGFKPRLIGTPFNALFNGECAVIFFFTLSGFVLSFRFLRGPDLTYLAASVAKRLPRLMLPAGLSILCGFALISSGGMFFSEASKITQSQWLASMANAVPSEGFHPQLLDAVKQILTVFLFKNNYSYNSNLWTMRPEFVGSLLVFVAVLIVLVPVGRAVQLGAILLATAGLRSFLPTLTPFMVGVAIALLLSKWDVRRSDGWVTAMVLLAVAVFGFASTNYDINILTSAILIMGLSVCKCAAGPLSGAVGKRLGEISFPLYLVHTLVILSAASFTFTVFAPVAPGLALVVAAIVTAGCSVAALLPFVFIDRWWVSWLNSIVKGAQRRLGVPIPQRRGTQ
jgi:peptidoglycan/LPS O-acetylase OafA/YrhL